VRVVAENDDFTTLAPYAPRFPFETWILPKRHESAFENSSSPMFQNLAKAIKTLLLKADRVAGQSALQPGDPQLSGAGPEQRLLPLALGIHAQADQDRRFEWGTGFYINPTPPEEAARFLREAKIEEPASAAIG
jgi:UDPglucose--hexose-1-phosphate uridylyltransferase